MANESKPYNVVTDQRGWSMFVGIVVNCPNCGKWPMYHCPVSDHSPCACCCHDVEATIHSLTTKGAKLNKRYPEIAEALVRKVEVAQVMREEAANG